MKYTFKLIISFQILFFPLSAAFAGETAFLVASYNVENLFDLKEDQTEYNEYIPDNNYNWNRRTFDVSVKSKNVSSCNYDFSA